ncbi:hypothetical protein BHAOGJBA_1200 [Methylobacterium hispanicum]|uniref:Uncharacterized protein n=1 Tax=Methylobacterium hispanicum TaxID=270350 RepID=A0AAV4ZGX7_9HYPH|nr:hypothetical protein [Methylobacterium hispanicum]GJD87695.1 hypothetical protein BHAOGJBA_1200 [Methylobacterium hispanicum]
MKDTLIEVPFGYALKGRKKGQRNDRDYIRETTVTVAIASPDADEAPVALVWHRRGRWGDEGFQHPARDFRFFAGRLWRPVDFENGYDKPDSQIVRSEFLDAVARREDCAANLLQAGARRSWWDYETKLDGAIDLGNALIVSSSEEDAVAAEIRSKAGKLILVDGKMYGETSEPMYVVGQGRFQHNLGAEVVPLHTIHPPMDVAKHFRADQLPEVLEAIASRFSRRELDFDPENPASFVAYVPDWVEVREGFAHVLTYRHDQTPQLLAGVKRALEYLGKTLADQPIPVLLAFGELRDAAARGEPGALVADRAEVLCDALKRDAFEAKMLREEIEKFRIAPVADASALAGPKP